MLAQTCCLLPYLVLVTDSTWAFPESCYSDYATYQLPIRDYVKRELLSGTFPLRNPHLLCGQALHASQQAAICDPLMTPWLLLFPTDQAIRIGLFVQFSFAAFGQTLLCRWFGLSLSATLAACSLVSGSGFVVLHLLEGHLGLVGAACRIPMVGVCFVHACSMQTGRSAVRLGLSVALVYLSGHPQLVYYIIVLLTAAILWTLIKLLRGAGSDYRRQFAVLVAATVFAALASAIQWLPTAEWMLRNSNVDERAEDEFMRAHGLELQDVASLFDSNVSHRLTADDHATGRLTYAHEKSLWIGYAATILLGLGWLTATRMQRSVSLGAIGALGFLVSSTSTPADGLISVIIPGWSWFRCHGRIWGGLLPLVGLLTAVVIDRLSEALGSRFGASVPVVRPVTIRCLLAASVVGEVFCFAWNTTTQPSNTVGPTASKVMAAAGLSRTSRFLEWPNPPELTLNQLRYARRVSLAMSGSRSMPGSNEGGPRSVAQQLIHGSLQQAPVSASSLLGCDSFVIGRANDVVANPGCLAVVRTHSETFSNLLPVALPIVAAGQTEAVRTSCDQSSVLVITATANSFTIQCERPSVGWLVLAESFDAGWQATIDHRLADLVPVHGCLMGIHVPAGRSVIRLRYRSLGFVIGVWVSLISVGSGVSLLVRHRRCGLV